MTDLNIPEQDHFLHEFVDFDELSQEIQQGKQFPNIEQAQALARNFFNSEPAAKEAVYVVASDFPVEEYPALFLFRFSKKNNVKFLWRIR